MFIIGIAGRMQVGKDTAAKVIGKLIDTRSEYSDCSYIIAHFADELKRIVSCVTRCSYMDLNVAEFKASIIPNFIKVSDLRDGKIKRVCKKGEYNSTHNPFKSESDVTYREALQFFGQKLRDILGKDYWVNCLLDMYYYPGYENEILLIPDVRYENEAEAIRKRRGYVIKVNRDTGLISNHDSETEMDNYKPNFIIENTADLTTYEYQVEKVFKMIMDDRRRTKNNS